MSVILHNRLPQNLHLGFNIVTLFSHGFWVGNLNRAPEDQLVCVPQFLGLQPGGLIGWNLLAGSSLTSPVGPCASQAP